MVCDSHLAILLLIIRLLIANYQLINRASSSRTLGFNILIMHEDLGRGAYKTFKKGGGSEAVASLAISTTSVHGGLEQVQFNWEYIQPT